MVDRKTAHAKYKGHCAYCGKSILYKDMQVDHIKPKKQGGTDEVKNLNPSCRLCNHYKRASGLEGYRRKLATLLKRVKDIYINKVAEDYGMIEYHKWDKKFYFEKEKE